MAKGSNAYNWSDAWLLLSIIYAGRGGAATLQRIITIGDGINHAIFSADEFESGLARLTSGGYIKEKDGVFSATPEVMRDYAKTTTPRRAIYKELEDVARLIGAASDMSEQPHQNEQKYAGFSTAAFGEAVGKYCKR